MLNSVLVEMLIAVHRTRRTGVLVLEGGGVRRGLGFVNGEPVAMVMSGRKVDLVLAGLEAMHRITPVMRTEAAQVPEQALSGLVAAQAVTQAEVDQATQVMVEDELVALLSGAGQPEFTDENPDQLDYAGAAIRMRIDPQTLIKTAGARVAEDRLVAEQIGGESAVFALSEGAGSMPLTDDERQTLNQVDGSRSVREIAEAMRLSVAQVGRLLRGLLAKGLVRRLADKGTRTLRQFTPVVPLDRRPDLVGGTVVRRRSPLMAVALAGVLIAVAAVWWLVSQDQERRRQFALRLDQVATAIEARRWVEADQQLDKLLKEVAQDLSSRRLVEERRRAFDQRLGEERRRIEAAIEERRFAGLRNAIAAMPTGAETTAQMQRLGLAEERLAKLALAIQTMVEGQVSRGDLAGAAIELARHPSPERDGGERVLRDEMVKFLENARSRNEPLARRVQRLDQVLAAGPTPMQRQQIGEIRDEIADAQRQLGIQLDSLQAKADAGEVVAVRDAIRVDAIARMVEDSELSQRLARLERTLAKADADVEAAKESLRLLIVGTPGSASSAVFAQAAEVERRLPRHPEVAAVARMAVMANAIELQTRGATIEQEIPLLTERRRSQTGDDEKLLIARIETLTERSKVAQRLLDAAVEPLRDQDLDQAEQRLRALLGHTAAQRSSILAEARERLADVEQRQALRRRLGGRLEEAIARGDIAAAVAMARDMGERHLPVRIESVPSTASVQINGKPAGTTPLVLRLGALERSQATITLSLPGYEPLTLSGADAEGGWRIAGELRRQPAAVVNLGKLVSTGLAESAGALIAGSRSAALRIAPGGGTEILLDRSGAFDAPPLLAPPARLADGWWFVAPDGAAWIVDGEKATRTVLPVGSRVALSATMSEILPDQRWILIAGEQGRIVGVDPRAGGSWTGPGGAAFAGPLLPWKGSVLAVRQDGTLQAVSSEDGAVRPGGAALGERVLAAWPGADGYRIITPTRSLRWDGRTVRALTAPPGEILAAGRDVALLGLGRVWIADGETWREAGRITPGTVPGASMIVWNGHAVIPVGSQVQVVGARGFTHRGQAQIAGVGVVDGQLAVVDVAGKATFYAP